MNVTQKQKLIFIIAAVVIFSVLGTVLLIWEGKTPEPELIVQGQTQTAEPSPSPAKSSTVHIKGAVINEGVYTLTGEARLNDAIQLAGGLKENANMQDINLAMPVSDGDEITIPFLSAAEPNKTATSTPKKVITSSSESREKIVSNPDQPKAKTPDAPKIININTASLAELETLKGVGPATAQKIIDYREKKPFKNIDDIKNVSGIGEKKFEAMKDFISVN